MNSRAVPPDPALNGDITGGLSSASIIAISISGFIIVFTTLAILYKFSSNPDDKQRDRARRHQQDNDNDAADYERALEDADVSKLNRAQRRARAKNRMKKNRRLAPHRQPQPANPQPNQDDGQPQHGEQLPPAQIAAPQPPAEIVEDYDNDGSGGANGEWLSRKERQRVAKAEERRERLLYVEERKQQIFIQEQKLSKDRKNQEERERENERDSKERNDRLEMEGKLALEREYREWNLMFPPSTHDERSHTDDDTVIGSGDSDYSQCETVQQFLAKLYTVKRISLAKTAEQYSISIPSLRRRLTQLEKEGRIHHCGIIDETRGEYVVVTSEDMEKLARYIQQVGCVTSDEVRSCLVDILKLTGDTCAEDLTMVTGNGNEALSMVV